MTKKEIQNSLKELETTELLELQKEIEEELKRRNGKATITLYYNKYKGTGKCWVAEIDQYGKILKFVNPIGGKKDWNRGERTFELQEGKRYRLHSVGTKTVDTKQYVTVEKGEIKNIKI